MRRRMRLATLAAMLFAALAIALPAGTSPASAAPAHVAKAQDATDCKWTDGALLANKVSNGSGSYLRLAGSSTGDGYGAEVFINFTDDVTEWCSSDWGSGTGAIPGTDQYVIGDTNGGCLTENASVLLNGWPRIDYQTCQYEQGAIPIAAQTWDIASSVSLDSTTVSNTVWIHNEYEYLHEGSPASPYGNTCMDGDAGSSSDYVVATCFNTSPGTQDDNWWLAQP